MKRLTKADLKGMNIINPWDLAGCQDVPKVYVDYTPYSPDGFTRFAAWLVMNISFHTKKEFACYSPRRDKESKRVEALAWATEHYSIAEWERSPFGSYHPKGTLAKIGVRG